MLSRDLRSPAITSIMVKAGGLDGDLDYIGVVLSLSPLSPKSNITISHGCLTPAGSRPYTRISSLSAFSGNFSSVLILFDFNFIEINTNSIEVHLITES